MDICVVIIISVVTRLLIFVDAVPDSSLLSSRLHFIFAPATFFRFLTLFLNRLSRLFHLRRLWLFCGCLIQVITVIVIVSIAVAIAIVVAIILVIIVIICSFITFIVVLLRF